MTELEEALSPNTTPARLELLAKSNDSSVVSAVTKNPNTPSNILFPLIERFPEEFLENPILPLLLLEQPNLLSSLPVSGLCAMLRFSSIPEWLLTAAIQHRHPSVREAAAMRPSISLEQLTRLSTDRAERVLRAVLTHPKMTPSILMSMSTESTYWIRMRARDASVQIAKDPNTPEEILRQFYRSPHSWIRAALAQNQSTPADILEALVADENGEVRLALVGNPKAPLALLRRLKGDKNVGVREIVGRLLREQRARELQQQDPNTDE